MVFVDDTLLRDLIQLSSEHVWLVALSLTIAAAIGIPTGILLTRRKSLQGWILSVVSIVQTIPSLALFGFLIPVPLIGGIGPKVAIIALVLYALLPIVRNTFVGITSVDPAVRETAVALGMTSRQLLWKVELPLAMRTISAGIRVAAVATIGTATIAAAIGAGGLGVFIFRGIATVDTTQIFAGALPAAIMALITEWGLGWIERRLSPY